MGIVVLRWRYMMDVIPTLQVAIGPVILISAVGLLLLTTSNRMAHIIDRTRTLHTARAQANGNMLERHNEQIAILVRRARLIRASIECLALSALCDAVLVGALFFAPLLGERSIWIVGVLFLAALAALIASLALLILDVRKSLNALVVEIA